MWLGFDTTPEMTKRLKIKKNGEKIIKNQIKKYRRIRIKEKNAIDNRISFLLSNPSTPQYAIIQNNIRETTVDPEVYNIIQKMVDTNAKLKPHLKKTKKINGYTVKDWDMDRHMDANIGDNWVRKVMKVEGGNDCMSCPCSTNRLYSSITSFPGEVRRCLRHNKDSLFYIDISNCQPFIFLYFIMEYLNGEITPDVALYIDLVCNGQLYEFMMEKLGRTDIVKKDTSEMTPEEEREYDEKRSVFKVDFFGKVFFSTERRYWKERKIFDMYFPTVSKVISTMKDGNYKNLPIQLQKFEAKLILDNVFYQLAIRHGNSYAVPLHDAVICEAKIKDVVCDIIYETMEAMVGFRPTLKIKKLC